MSFKKKSESQWVDALNRGRMNRTKIAPDGKRESKMEESQLGSREEKMQPPPPPSLSAKEEEIAAGKISREDWEGNAEADRIATEAAKNIKPQNLSGIARNTE